MTDTMTRTRALTGAALLTLAAATAACSSSHEAAPAADAAAPLAVRTATVASAAITDASEAGGIVQVRATRIGLSNAVARCLYVVPEAGSR